MARQIEEGVDFCDGHSFSGLADLHYCVARPDLAFLQDAKVEPRTTTRCEQRGHLGVVHPNAQAIAGNARLGDLEKRAADLITIANAHHIVRQSFDREVFAELSVDKVGPSQLLLPVTIRFDLVDVDGTLLTPMPGKIALTVPIEIEAAHAAAPAHGILPDPRVHGATLPRD